MDLSKEKTKKYFWRIIKAVLLIVITGFLISKIKGSITIIIQDGNLADWFSAVGTVGALFFVIYQQYIEKRRYNSDRMYNKLSVLFDDLESMKVRTIDIYKADNIWLNKICRLPQPKINIEGFDLFERLTDKVNKNNPEIGDYLRKLYLVLNELEKNKKNIDLNDYLFLIEMLKVKTNKDKFNLIIWNIMFSKDSSKLKNKLKGTGFFSEKTKKHFEAEYKAKGFICLIPIDNKIRTEISKVDRKK